MRTQTSRLIQLTFVAALGLFCAGILEAHATLQKAAPAGGATVSAAPTSIQLWFDEEVDLKVTKIAVAGPSGAVALGPTRLADPKTLMAPITGKLADGVYTVTWQTAAADDGHVTNGNFKFTVKQTH